MAYSVKKYQKFAIKQEVTEGVYAAPVNSDFIRTLAAGVTINKSRDEQVRDLLTSDRITKFKELTLRKVDVTFEVELTSGPTPGAKPDYSEVIESFGMTNIGFAVAVTTAEDHTTSRIFIEPGDIAKFRKNMVVKVMQDGAHHRSPISAVGADYIDLAHPMASAPDDNVLLAPNTQYILDQDANKSCSLTKIFEGNKVQERVVGAKTQEMTVNNMTVGSIPTFSFKMMGMNFYDILEDSSFVPAYSAVKPASAIKACVLVDGVKYVISELGLTFGQTLSALSSLCEENGVVTTRGTDTYNISATINPAKTTESLGFLMDNAKHTLFSHTANPLVADYSETENDICFYFPEVLVTKTAGVDLEGWDGETVTMESVPSVIENGAVIVFF